MTIFQSIDRGFNSVVHTIEKPFEFVADTARSGVKFVGNIPTNLVSFMRGQVHFVGQEASNLIRTPIQAVSQGASQVITSGGQAVGTGLKGAGEGIGSAIPNLGLYLAIGAGIFLVMNQDRIFPKSRK